MDNFNKALKHTLQFEGGYASDPDDSGGETFRGISRRNWPNWPGWKLIDQAKGSGLRGAAAINKAFEGDALMAELVADFYWQNFWRPFEKLGLPPSLTAKLFDTAVNTGIGGASRILQQAICVIKPGALKIDGAIGPLTLAALRNIPEADLLEAFVDQQTFYYQGIVSRRPSQAKFLNGWMRRAAWLPDEVFK